MSYLEELLPEFRKGAKIRKKEWNNKKAYYYYKNGRIYDYTGSTMYAFSSSALSYDGWEFYKESIDWSRIIDKRCLCWFWNEGKEERIANFLHSVTIAPNKGFTDIDRGFWDHCCPVSKKEITFYEDEK